MADDPVVLLVKYRSINHIVRELKPDSTAEQLKEALAKVTNTTKVGFRVLFGFPPRLKELNNPLETLEQLGLKSGETLIVEQLSMKENLRKNLNDSTIQVPACTTKGVFLKRVVPADNSCLFTSVYFLISEGSLDITCAPAMRQMIADAVKADSETYTEAFLGKSNSAYRKWILKEDSWGGAIELSILSAHFGLELAVVDAQTARIDCFGEDRHYPIRGFLLYDGIHYDPLFWELEGIVSSSSEDQDAISYKKPLFLSSDQTAHQMALEVGISCKNAKNFTNVQKFALRCLVCNAALVGQQNAVQHAQETGHSNFAEES